MHGVPLTLRMTILELYRFSPIHVKVKSGSVTGKLFQLRKNELAFNDFVSIINYCRMFQYMVVQ